MGNPQVQGRGSHVVGEHALQAHKEQPCREGDASPDVVQ